MDKDFHTRAAANRDAGRHNVIVAGESYGQGSSREHAAMCPMYLGVKVVLARSIERIHLANLINFGIVPFSFANPADYDAIAAGDWLAIDNLRAVVSGDGRAELKNLTQGKCIPVVATLTARQKRLLLAGGLLPAVARGEA